MVTPPQEESHNEDTVSCLKHKECVFLLGETWRNQCVHTELYLVRDLRHVDMFNPCAPKLGQV